MKMKFLCQRTRAWDETKSDKTIGFRWKEMHRTSKLGGIKSQPEFVSYISEINLSFFVLIFFGYSLSPENGSETITFNKKCGIDSEMKTIIFAKYSGLRSEQINC